MEEKKESVLFKKLDLVFVYSFIFVIGIGINVKAYEYKIKDWFKIHKKDIKHIFFLIIYVIMNMYRR